MVLGFGWWLDIKNTFFGKSVCLNMHFEGFLKDWNVHLILVIVVCVFFNLLWLIYKCYQKFVIFGHRHGYALYQAVLDDDKFKCMRIMDKHPLTVNFRVPPGNYTPFLVACATGNTYIVRLMLKYGAILESRTLKKETGFFLAVLKSLSAPLDQDATCIHALYSAGADINACNASGYNALQLAAVYGHVGLAQWLISKGANQLVTPTPYNLARHNGHLETANALKALRVPCLKLH